MNSLVQVKVKEPFIRILLRYMDVQGRAKL